MTGKQQVDDLSALVNKFVAIIGKENVLTDEGSLQLYSMDLSKMPSVTGVAVVRPSTTEHVAEVVKAAISAGFAITVRGGSTSYTHGHVPKCPNTVVVDMCRMNKIIEINPKDLYVTVETGVTWKELREALRRMPYYIPFMGTLSGIKATVGGGLGNNATGLGRGCITDDLLGLEVVLSDGRVIQTGGRAAKDGRSFVRGWGPDLTGIFINDAGAFGIKTKATFRLVARPRGLGYVSFGFQDTHKLVDALIEIAGTNLTAELFCFSRYHNTQFAREPKPPIKEAIPLFKEIVHSSSSLFRGVRDVLRLAIAGGPGFLEPWEHTLHAVVEGFDQCVADRGVKVVKRIGKRYGGKLLPPSMPMMLRVDPYQPVERLILGVNNEIGLPSHCNVPLSKAHEFVSALDNYFRENKSLMQKHRIIVTTVYLAEKSLFGPEPVLYWSDSLSSLRLSVIQNQEKREMLSKIPANIEAREAAFDLRKGMREIFKAFGGSNLQYGKYYPYREFLASEDTWKLMKDMKACLDSNNLMNPGALDLN